MSDEHIPVIVLLGINTHKCSSCGVRGEWGPGPDQPTDEDLAKPCPKCGGGPFVALSKGERDEEWNRGKSKEGGAA